MRAYDYYFKNGLGIRIHVVLYFIVNDDCIYFACDKYTDSWHVGEGYSPHN